MSINGYLDVPAASVVLRVSSRPTADVWNTRCNAEWWRPFLNPLKSQIRCSMEINLVPTKHSSRASIARSYVRLKMRDHNAMDFGCSRNCHIWVKCNRYNCHELRLGLQSLAMWDHCLHQLLHEFPKMSFFSSSMLLDAHSKAESQRGIPRHGPTHDDTTEETSLQRIRWMRFAPKLSCWKLSQTFLCFQECQHF